jgi:hypothetical protein
MIRKSFLFVSLTFTVLSSSGCFLLLAGAAGGAGTAVWLQSKLSQTVNGPLPQAIQGAKAGLADLKVVVDKETTEPDVTQLKGEFDGKPYWVDIRKVTDRSSKIEVRVGVPGDEKATRRIMEAIMKHL